jgi:hypothetical protein
MGVAGGEKTIRRWEAWILLNREEQLRHRLIEAPAEEMRGAYLMERRADPGARTETPRGLEVLDSGVGLGGKI